MKTSLTYHSKILMAAIIFNIASLFFTSAHAVTSEDPTMEGIIMKAKESGDTDMVAIFERAENIRQCRATPEVKLKGGAILNAMSEEEVKEWIYYNHMYPYNCRY